MSHFARIENGIVVQVIVAEQDFISTGALGDPASFVQTSYNTRGNMHFDANGVADAGGFFTARSRFRRKPKLALHWWLHVSAGRTAQARAGPVGRHHAPGHHGAIRHNVARSSPPCAGRNHHCPGPRGR